MTPVLLLLLAASAASASAAVSPLGREAADLLKALVRVDTTNPPGSEAGAAAVLADFLRKAEVPYEVVESSPGRANLVARLKGTGLRRPLLLLSHLDTVGVERARWSFPPFAGDEKDGAVRGRGAVDDKGMAAAFAAVMADLSRRKVPLKRDVVFAATADEESGGALGVRWLLERRPELLDAELALNEGGTTFSSEGKVRVVAVQVAEKAYFDLTLSARGSGGHASVPDPENPLLRLARALVRLEEWRPAPRLSAVTRATFAALRGLESPELSAAFDDVLSDDEERVERGAEALRERPYYGAMVWDTWAPTLASGGVRENVHPSEAALNLNVRILPGSSPEAFLTEVRAHVADLGVEAEWASGPVEATPPVMPLEGEFWKAMRKAVAARSPGASVIPSLSVGSTDAAALRQHGVLVYGLDFPLTPDDQSRIHGHDERMPLSALDYGTRLVADLVAELSQ